MAKINHSNAYDVINEILIDATNRGIMHLHTDADETPERKLKISGKEVLNFGTCGYLGLELDQRLKDKGIELMQKYGTQFSVSRSYLQSGIQEQLEHYLSRMFNNSPVITYSSTTIAHISVIPLLVKHNDAVILDQQVHMSVQNAAQLLRQKGTLIEKIRHSNLQMLEDKLKELSQKYERVWYMIDGVYSMFGDLAPIDELIVLMEKYKKLHLYIDDAHGIGWCGKNGAGYAFNKISNHPKTMLVTTLAKGFGVMGGLAVFPDQESYQKINIFGGPLGYSHPLTPALIGSSIASAEILLSDECEVIQNELCERMDYCTELLSKTNLTVLSNSNTPINFIGMGELKVGYNMVKRLLNDGFFVNTALFPVVALHQTGLRFTITRHIQKHDIKQLVDAIVYHYPKVLEEEGKAVEDVQKVFGKQKPENFDSVILQKAPAIERHNNIVLEESTSIINVSMAQWDSMLGKNGNFDWMGMLSLERVFQNNSKPEENWNFYYFIIRDNDTQKPILATFFTSTIIKDDMLSLEGISLQVEEERKKNPYYLTSMALMIGSMLTEGHHYYVDKKHPQWKQAVKLLLNRVEQIRDKINANTVLLRDFDKDDTEFKEIFIKEGFAVVDMPNSNIIENMNWNTPQELLNTLSYKSRRGLNTEVFRHEHKFEVEYKSVLTYEECEWFYHLYKNVQNNNLGFNMFPYPKDILKILSKKPAWEFIVIKLKREYDLREDRKAVAVIWSYVTDTHYSPMIMGLDYNYLHEYKVYKQATFQYLKRARILGLTKVYMGLSADLEKHKFGASIHARVAYMKVNDNFNMEIIESMSATATKLFK